VQHYEKKERKKQKSADEGYVSYYVRTNWSVCKWLQCLNEGDEWWHAYLIVVVNKHFCVLYIKILRLWITTTKCSPYLPNPATSSSALLLFSLYFPFPNHEIMVYQTLLPTNPSNNLLLILKSCHKTQILWCLAYEVMSNKPF